MELVKWSHLAQDRTAPSGGLLWTW